MHHLASWLGAGHLLARRRDGSGWVLHTPDGAVLEVDESLAPGTCGPSELSAPAVTAAFTAAGFGASPVSDRELRDVLVRLLGDPRDRVLAALGDRLTLMGAQVEAVEPVRVDSVLACPNPQPHQQVVVACSQYPGTDDWLRWERLLPMPSAWMRVSVEGARAYLEPPSTGADGVGHRSVRARRVAASRWPVEQRDLWRGDAVVGSSMLSPGATELLVELLIADMVEYVQAAPGARLAFARTLRLLDLNSLQLTAHPIFPVPATTQWRDT